MKKIITAIDNSEINEMLKKEYEIISKDILYKEGILEQLQKTKSVDIIIIDERIDGLIKLNTLIKKIKEKVKNIEIIIITDNKNRVYEETKRYKRIQIYETNKIKIKKLESLINSKTEKIKERKQNTSNIISISGAEGTGKTMTSIVFSELNLKSNNLLVDFNTIENQNISLIFNKENNSNIQSINKELKFISTNKVSVLKNKLENENFENIIIDLGNKIDKKEKEEILNKSNKNLILLESNLIGIKKCKNIINYYMEELKIKEEKIKIIINKKNENSIDKKIIKNIFKKIEIIGEIKNNNNYNKLMNKTFKNLSINIKKEEKENIRKIIKKATLI